MAFYHDHILPCLTHLAMSNRRLAGYRRRVVSQARGRALEIGVGSGLNLPLYGRDGGEVESVYGIDPSPGLLRRAAHRRTAGTALIEASAEVIPFDRDTFDTVVTSWTLCTIPGVVVALQQMCRVLRPDGRLLFVEHGRAPDPGVVRWQDRLTPCWKCFGGGCHLNRKIDDLISVAGFRIERLDTGYLGGHNPFTFMYEGAARK
jgi:ubiquinone/menaquinone biosynthesis C-methylase UbiE